MNLVRTLKNSMLFTSSD